MANPNFREALNSPEAMAKRKATRKTRLANRALTKNERKFVDVYLETGSLTRAGEAVGMKNPETHSHEWLKKPQIARVITKITERAEEKIVEKASDKIAAMLDIADDRLMEVLAAKRGIATEETMRRGGDVPVEDAHLLKAVDLAYKRKGAYPNEKATSNTINGNVTVFQSAWVKQPAQLPETINAES